ncbi:MAG: hypothetical protein WAT51_15890 [Holophaga sp.]
MTGLISAYQEVSRGRIDCDTTQDRPVFRTNSNEVKRMGVDHPARSFPGVDQNPVTAVNCWLQFVAMGQDEKQFGSGAFSQSLQELLDDL